VLRYRLWLYLPIRALRLQRLQSLHSLSYRLPEQLMVS